MVSEFIRNQTKFNEQIMKKLYHMEKLQRTIAMEVYKLDKKNPLRFWLPNVEDNMLAPHWGRYTPTRENNESFIFDPLILYHEVYPCLVSTLRLTSLTK